MEQAFDHLQRDERARARGNPADCAHTERLMVDVPHDWLVVTGIDGHPAPGPCTPPRGVEHFGQTSTIGDLCRHFGIGHDSVSA